MFGRPIMKESLPLDLVEKGKVSKYRVLSRQCDTGIYEVTVLELSPGAKIAKHKHTNDRELYIRLDTLSISICEMGESHFLENDTDKPLMVISIKER